MGRLIDLISDREIQILVLLSFTLQLFLFFAGRLRRGNSNGFLRLCLWGAYLGADIAAVYALGYLSRRQDVTIDTNLLTGTQPLAFFWAPFFLIHLGGQDTITAFAMEDNNLWLRHLLNLVTQVVLALYVFWKSIGKHSANLLLAGSFVFVTGIIKYAERTWSLKCGSLRSLESSDSDRYTRKLPQELSRDAGFVRDALYHMTYVVDVLSERAMLRLVEDRHLFNKEDDKDLLVRMVSLQLGMIHDDLYTKSFVLRTRSGVILRCISHAAVIVAFALFLANGKERYSKADIAITYSLFLGCLFLEVSSMVVSMMSPWTWAWFKVQNCDALASFSWFVFRSDTGYPKMKQRWPNLIGQYNISSWVFDRDQQRRKYSQRIMIMFKKLFSGLFRVKKEKLFWMSKLVDTEYMDLDNMILKRVVEEITLLLCDFDIIDEPKGWQKIGIMLTGTHKICYANFGLSIVFMHLVTQMHLETYASFKSDIEAVGLMKVCGKLSKYMMYLLVTQPSMLPLSVSAAATLDMVQQPGKVTESCEDIKLETSKETLEELARMWTRLLIYSAGKSRGHASQLSGGGELITFAWLLMAHYGIGENHNKRIHLFRNDDANAADIRNVYAFCLPSGEMESGTHNRRSEWDDIPGF
ncbi:uncharacterized protein LOC100822391 isoform X1 [Brachypodium distachyon]|uniref:uncharacterized protein LOC100822391 isoform X1 n=1 Tax=Brachypodium distachyon TaxID=15368 RepID=UPI000D0D23B0|nr:uncharacterized protein LOC100822391 isoform X1 [Brachypodium distachyon]|eukprot:XP_024319327.1 uncharacterized protein LOC100822391 isoform X1 [Brachypodium distachyon]